MFSVSFMFQVSRKLGSVRNTGIEISLVGTLQTFGWDSLWKPECNWEGSSRDFIFGGLSVNNY